ncbi:MAG: trehalose-phosphatase [Solirubrobacterales bacterium]|nr:trehalose-phosphatase [Solirubrobacterales bacterium]MBV9366948.1 trehalose-phosphatase [Solirubrobacterales bacterium]MBV9805948.1 trehalose-phosphatase [Solirubrobacterales bacterium]
MSIHSSTIEDLPSALGDELAQRLAGARPAVFLDYDGTLTPIVDRPQDATISPRMRDVVSSLASRCPVCVVSGRDRSVVQELMGIHNLVVAGSHGFDIWSPERGTIEHEAASGFEDLLARVTARLQEELGPIEGAVVEPKRASVAAHYRLVAPAQRPEVQQVVERVLADHPEDLKVTPGKMVYELQPRLDWDKGRAVLHLIAVLGLDREDDTAIYVGDDITDEHAFEALSGRGIGIFVGDPQDPEVANRTTAADFRLGSIEEVEQFLDGLAR